MRAGRLGMLPFSTALSPFLYGSLGLPGDGAQEQAAGALRSVCVNSPVNKLELNRVNGIFSLDDVMRSGSLPGM